MNTASDTETSDAGQPSQTHATWDEQLEAYNNDELSLREWALASTGEAWRRAFEADLVSIDLWLDACAQRDIATKRRFWVNATAPADDRSDHSQSEDEEEDEETKIQRAQFENSVERRKIEQKLFEMEEADLPDDEEIQRQWRLLADSRAEDGIRHQSQHTLESYIDARGKELLREDGCLVEALEEDIKHLEKEIADLAAEHDILQQRYVRAEYRVSTQTKAERIAEKNQLQEKLAGNGLEPTHKLEIEYQLGQKGYSIFDLDIQQKVALQAINHQLLDPETYHEEQLRLIASRRHDLARFKANLEGLEHEFAENPSEQIALFRVRGLLSLCICEDGLLIAEDQRLHISARTRDGENIPQLENSLTALQTNTKALRDKMQSVSLQMKRIKRLEDFGERLTQTEPGDDAYPARAQFEREIRILGGQLSYEYLKLADIDQRARPDTETSEEIKRSQLRSRIQSIASERSLDTETYCAHLEKELGRLMSKQKNETLSPEDPSFRQLAACLAQLQFGRSEQVFFEHLATLHQDEHGIAIAAPIEPESPAQSEAGVALDDPGIESIGSERESQTGVEDNAGNTTNSSDDEAGIELSDSDESAQSLSGIQRQRDFATSAYDFVFAALDRLGVLEQELGDRTPDDGDENIRRAHTEKHFLESELMVRTIRHQLDEIALDLAAMGLPALEPTIELPERVAELQTQLNSGAMDDNEYPLAQTELELRQLQQRLEIASNSWQPEYESAQSMREMDQQLAKLSQALESADQDDEETLDLLANKKTALERRIDNVTTLAKLRNQLKGQLLAAETLRVMQAIADAKIALHQSSIAYHSIKIADQLESLSSNLNAQQERQQSLQAVLTKRYLELHPERASEANAEQNASDETIAALGERLTTAVEALEHHISTFDVSDAGERLIQDQARQLHREAVTTQQYLDTLSDQGWTINQKFNAVAQAASTTNDLRRGWTEIEAERKQYRETLAEDGEIDVATRQPSHDEERGDQPIIMVSGFEQAVQTLEQIRRLQQQIQYATQFARRLQSLDAGIRRFANDLIGHLDHYLSRARAGQQQVLSGQGRAASSPNGSTAWILTPAQINTLSASIRNNDGVLRGLESQWGVRLQQLVVRYMQALTGQRNRLNALPALHHEQDPQLITTRQSLTTSIDTLRPGEQPPQTTPAIQAMENALNHDWQTHRAREQTVRQIEAREPAALSRLQTRVMGRLSTQNQEREALQERFDFFEPTVRRLRAAERRLDIAQGCLARQTAGFDNLRQLGQQPPTVSRLLEIEQSLTTFENEREQHLEPALTGLATLAQRWQIEQRSRLRTEVEELTKMAERIGRLQTDVNTLRHPVPPPPPGPLSRPLAPWVPHVNGQTEVINLQNALANGDTRFMQMGQPRPGRTLAAATYMEPTPGNPTSMRFAEYSPNAGNLFVRIFDVPPNLQGEIARQARQQLGRATLQAGDRLTFTVREQSRMDSIKDTLRRFRH